MRRRRNPWAAAGALAAVLVTAGCTVPVAGSAPSSTAVAPPASSSVVPAVSGQVVTVPGLGAVTSAAATSAPSSSAAELPPSSTSAPSASSAAEPVLPTPPSATAGPSSAPTPVPAVTGRTAEVDLSGTCPECSVLSSRAEVVGELSMAVVSMPGGRTAAMAIRSDGSSASILAIPYGITFPTPAGGVLPCDSGGRCLVAATTPDGGVVTALGLGADGKLTDLSPPDGFVSVGVPAQIVDLDGEPGVAVLEVPGTEPVWTVYSWIGDTYGPAGCTTGSTPDLAELAMSLCG